MTYEWSSIMNSCFDYVVFKSAVNRNTILMSHVVRMNCIFLLELRKQ